MVDNVNNVSFLGILIDNKYNWDYHISYIRVTLSRSIYIINKIKNKLPLKYCIQIYHSILKVI